MILFRAALLFFRGIGQAFLVERFEPQLVRHRRAVEGGRRRDNVSLKIGEAIGSSPGNGVGIAGSEDSFPLDGEAGEIS